MRGSPREAARAGAPRLGRAVVNGTRENDWPAVEAYCARHPWARRSFGLHPWHVAAREPALARPLARNCSRAIPKRPSARSASTAGSRTSPPRRSSKSSPRNSRSPPARPPVTIHCLRAWGALYDHLRAIPCRSAASCSTPTAARRRWWQVSRLGAYFSFSAYFLHPRKAAAREVFRHLPADRLLVETDAPDMAPPPERARFHLIDPRPARRSTIPGTSRWLMKRWPRCEAGRWPSWPAWWKQTSFGFSANE